MIFRLRRLFVRTLGGKKTEGSRKVRFSTLKVIALRAGCSAPSHEGARIETKQLRADIAQLVAAIKQRDILGEDTARNVKISRYLDLLLAWRYIVLVGNIR